MKRDTPHDGSDTLMRISALSGAALALFLAARRGTRSAWTGAAAVAVPMATRGLTGHWPMEEAARGQDPVEVSARFTLLCSAEEVFDRWRDLESLPGILRHVESVEEMEGGRSRWRARTPAGEVEWEAEILEEQWPRVLRWASVSGSAIDHRGHLRLIPWRDGQGTQMQLRMLIGPGLGGGGENGDTTSGVVRAARAVVAALVRPALEQQVEEDLRRFKSLLEAGEVPTTEGQPTGERGAVDIKNPF